MGLYSQLRNAAVRTLTKGTKGNIALGRGYKKSLQHAVNCGINPDVVYDVGAAMGTPWLYEAFPSAQHLLFEPLPLHIEILRKAYAAPKFEIHQVAIGEHRASGSLHVPSATSAKTTWSSLRKPTSAMQAYTEARGSSNDTQTIEVPIQPLDDFARAGEGVLKVDVEGSELDVLKGAQTVLSRCQMVIIEMSIFPRMDGEGRFADLIIFLKDHGFELFDIPLMFYPLAARDLTFIDGIFVRSQDHRVGQWMHR